MTPEVDRRRYRRVRAAILVRPLGPLARIAPRQVSDISAGGLRVFADEPQRVGGRIEIELVFPDGGSATCTAEVVWAERLVPGAPARFEMGLRFVEVDPDDLDGITAVLED
jgi:hypothetical protein